MKVDRIVIEYIKNMTPKERAFDLVEKFKFETLESEVLDRIVIGDMSVSFKQHKAKKCALIAVDEIIKAPHENTYIELIPSDADDTDWFWDKYDEYWNEVKQEIEKL